MEYTNAQKLAAVVAEWSRPAITQIAASKLLSLNSVRSLQNSIVKSGLVGQGYNIASEVSPFINNAVSTVAEPMLAKYFSSIPDEALPQLAHSVVDTAVQQPKFSILDGLIEFEQEDLYELKDLLEKNLPLSAAIENYKVIK